MIKLIPPWRTIGVNLWEEYTEGVDHHETLQRVLVCFSFVTECTIRFWDLQPREVFLQLLVIKFTGNTLVSYFTFLRTVRIRPINCFKRLICHRKMEPCRNRSSKTLSPPLCKFTVSHQACPKHSVAAYLVRSDADSSDCDSVGNASDLEVNDETQKG